jgi:hypothetical protein
MITRTNVAPIAIGDQIVAKIAERVAEATPEDREKVAELVALAIKHAADPVQQKITMTPGMGGIFWQDHNRFNRGWDAGWSNDIANIMTTGGWHPTSQGYALYGDDGDVADGGHRMAAQAFSNTTLDVYIYLGMSKLDVATLDCGKRRTASDAAALAGVHNAKAKTALLSAIWTYERTAKIPVPVQRSNNAAVAKQVEEHERMLMQATEIAETTMLDAISPLLEEEMAARVAGLLLRHGWPEARIIEQLEHLQTNDFENDKEPLAYARTYIEGKRPPKDIIKSAQEPGVIIRAMQIAETGLMMTSKNRFDQVENAQTNPPNPEYPALLARRTAAAD